MVFPLGAEMLKSWFFLLLILGLTGMLSACRVGKSTSAIKATELSRKLCQDANSDSVRVAKIYDWITSNIRYDFKAFWKGKPSAIGPDEVLSRKKAVCEGYARLMVALCQAQDIPAARVSGYTRNRFSDPDEAFLFPDHAWVAVRVNGRWFLFDPTWDSGYIQWFTPNFKNRIRRKLISKKGFSSSFRPRFVAQAGKEYYFRTGFGFSSTHIPDVALWQATSPNYSLAEIEKDSSLWKGQLRPDLPELPDSMADGARWNWCRWSEEEQTRNHGPLAAAFNPRNPSPASRSLLMDVQKRMEALVKIGSIPHKEEYDSLSLRLRKADLGLSQTRSQLKTYATARSKRNQELGRTALMRQRTRDRQFQQQKPEMANRKKLIFRLTEQLADWNRNTPGPACPPPENIEGGLPSTSVQRIRFAALLDSAQGLQTRLDSGFSNWNRMANAERNDYDTHLNLTRTYRIFNYQRMVSMREQLATDLIQEPQKVMRELARLGTRRDSLFKTPKGESRLVLLQSQMGVLRRSWDLAWKLEADLARSIESLRKNGFHRLADSVYVPYARFRQKLNRIREEALRTCLADLGDFSTQIPYIEVLTKNELTRSGKETAVHLRILQARETYLRTQTRKHETELSELESWSRKLKATLARLEQNRRKRG